MDKTRISLLTKMKLIGFYHNQTTSIKIMILHFMVNKTNNKDSKIRWINNNHSSFNTITSHRLIKVAIIDKKLMHLSNFINVLSWYDLWFVNPSPN